MLETCAGDKKGRFPGDPLRLCRGQRRRQMRRQRRRTPRRRNWLVQGTKKFAYPATKEKDFLEICWRHNSLVPGTKREDFLEGQFAHSGGKEDGLPGDPMRLWCCAGDKDVRLSPLFLVNPTPRHCHSFEQLALLQATPSEHSLRENTMAKSVRAQNIG